MGSEIIYKSLGAIKPRRGSQTRRWLAGTLSYVAVKWFNSSKMKPDLYFKTVSMHITGTNRSDLIKKEKN